MLESTNILRELDEDGELDAEDEPVDNDLVDAGHISSSEDEQSTTAQSYASLLRSLKPTFQPDTRPAKRRKLENGNLDERKDSANPDVFPSTKEDLVHDARLTEEADQDVDAAEEIDSDDDNVVLHDPFEAHYSNITEEELEAAIKAQSTRGTADKTTIGLGMRKLSTSFGFRTGRSSVGDQGARLKRRLKDSGVNVIKAQSGKEELDLLREVFEYRDILYGCRSHRNAGKLRDVTALHALNHIFKTRDKVLKNNARLAQAPGADLGDKCRDQGFTRPKVLVLVPTKQACVRYIDSIVKLSEPDQQENRKRFMDTFSQPEDAGFENKPEDFRELFGGNHEEDFRVGLKFTRKTIKFFSGFYNSDIILASPLGMMRTITTGGGKKDSKKGHDSDFLSSIELVIVDHANAMEMQNWQHVDYVFEQLNLIPKELHGSDIFRTRFWYGDGNAKYLRQTIILSDYLTPSISALATTHLHNIAGRVKYTPTYAGAMLELSPSIPMAITQTFLRFDSHAPQTDSDARFKFFTSTILPNLLRSTNKASSRGTLIFVPTYLDFVRLRNHFSTAAETTSLSFGTISEYSTRGDVARARSHFLSGRHSILLYSERAHHYFRYKLRGIRKLIFYGVPENPIFWTEMVDALGSTAQTDADWAQAQSAKQGRGLVRALFSKWDFMKLERVVGTDRVGRLVSEREGDVFDFV